MFRNGVLTVTTAVVLVGLLLVPACAAERPASERVHKGENKVSTATPASIYDFTVKDIDGKEVALSRYKGDVCLIVNVASKCGLTDSQYSGLESIYRTYREQGFHVLAFPANDFLRQEPGTNAQIKTFCEARDVSFPLFSKVSVKGRNQAPLYRFLTNHPDKAISGRVSWNFQKYLVGRDGTVLAKWSPRTTPTDKSVITPIEKALAAEVN